MYVTFKHKKRYKYKIVFIYIYIYTIRDYITFLTKLHF